MRSPGVVRGLWFGNVSLRTMSETEMTSYKLVIRPSSSFHDKKGLLCVIFFKQYLLLLQISCLVSVCRMPCMSTLIES